MADATNPTGARRGAAVMQALLGAPMLPILIVAALVMGLAMPGFLGPANLKNMAWLFGPLLISALGITFVFLIGGIDLSIGSTLSLATVLAALVMRESGSIALGAAVGIGTGMLVGVINGVAVALLRFPAFVHTFGMLLTLRAVAMLITGGSSVGRLPIETLRIGRGSLLGWLVGYLIRNSAVTGTDRVLGLLFGLARGLMAMILVVLVLKEGGFESESWWQRSKLIPYAAAAGEKFWALAGQQVKGLGEQAGVWF